MLRTLLLLGLMLGGYDAQAASTSHDPLDTARVRSLYLGGDFDQGIKWIDSHLAGPIPLTHADSVFGLEYLGVMQAANDAAWQAGKNDLRRLLTIDPSASIDALGASDRINAMFHDLQNEAKVPPHAVPANANQTASAGNMTAADSAATTAAGNAGPARGASASTNRTSNNTWLWVAGGVGAAALGTAVVLWTSSGSGTPSTQKIVMGN